MWIDFTWRKNCDIIRSSECFKYPENENFKETRLLLDTIRRRTYIIKDFLSVEFCLEYVGKETLTVCTIRNKKIKEISDERFQSQRKNWIIRVFHKS